MLNANGNLQTLLKLYKSQNRVERGFRFLKDPEFFADSIFVSKNEYIKALLMIMTFGLAVFSGADDNDSWTCRVQRIGMETA